MSTIAPRSLLAEVMLVTPALAVAGRGESAPAPIPTATAIPRTVLRTFSNRVRLEPIALFTFGRFVMAAPSVKVDKEEKLRPHYNSPLPLLFVKGILWIRGRTQEQFSTVTEKMYRTPFTP